VSAGKQKPLNILLLLLSYKCHFSKFSRDSRSRSRSPSYSKYAD